MSEPTWLVLAKEAKERLKVEMKELLGPAYRGVGICGENCLAVRVMSPEDVAKVPTTFEGYDIDCVAIGDIVAL